MSTPRAPFDWRAMVEEARRRLNQPPQHPLVRRCPPVGSWIVAFALPLGLCPTTNGTRRMPNWWYARNRDELFAAMLPQFLEVRRLRVPTNVGRAKFEPMGSQCITAGPRLTRGKALLGRPQIRAVRFCPLEKAGDPCSDWAKSAIDRLILPLHIRRAGKLVDCKRFGILRDDTLEAVDEHQWWEPARSGEEFAYLEVRSGDRVD